VEARNTRKNLPRSFTLFPACSYPPIRISSSRPSRVESEEPPAVFNDVSGPGLRPNVPKNVGTADSPINILSLLIFNDRIGGPESHSEAGR